MDNIDNQVQDNNVKKEGGYFGYYVFTFISAIIGFVMMFFATRLFIDDQVSKGNEFVARYKMIIAVIVAVIAVILFVIIAINLKKYLKKVFLSEIFLYLYIGFLTTMISIIVFRIMLNVLNAKEVEQGINWKLAEASAFLISVLFAFFADKLVVFKSLNLNPMKIFSEMGMFIGGRLITEGINFLIMYIMIDRLGQEEFKTKLIACVIVIVLNYLLSKFIIFKKVNKKEEIKLDTVEDLNPEIESAKEDENMETKETLEAKEEIKVEKDDENVEINTNEEIK